MSAPLGPRSASPEPRRRGMMKYLLLTFPALVSLCVPFYNRIEPRLFGFPFFYWLLLGLIPLSSLLTFIVHKWEKR
jgi:hypothetical protein